jgi:hypothetical protein
MLEAAKAFVKKTPLSIPFIYAKSLFTSPESQNEESAVLRKLLSRFDVPKRFVEFGFGGWEFTCASLAKEWEGLLLDGDAYNITIARTILPKRVTAVQQWITLETLDTIREWAAGRPIGVLSIDVDGNDYWFMEALIDLRPGIIVIEYNSVFGQRPVSVPYEADFAYFEKHPSRYYFGTSLAAVCSLAERHGYSLIEVGASGVNAFFVRSDLMGPDDIALDPVHAYREPRFYDGSRTSQQWEVIKHLPLIDVTTGAPYREDGPSA